MRVTRDRTTEAPPPPWHKAAVFGAAIALRTAFPRWPGPPRTTVLLYHRVSDDARDNLTVGVEQFDRQMAWIARRCHPMSLERWLTDGPPRDPRGPLVCVTFDDGYRDNFDHAAPILLRHGVPAAFFVATGFIGTDRPFPHDEVRGRTGIPTMSWEQLREMHGRGFTIGSHTVHHADCAAEPEDRIREELAQSLAALRSELGIAEAYFAYPYGGRANMTPERLELVRQAGYLGCLSAYGGVNVGRVDPFHVLRTGIHWEFSDLAFRFRCLGLA